MVYFLALKALVFFPTVVLLYIGYIRYCILTYSIGDFYSSQDIHGTTQLIMEGLGIAYKYQDFIKTFSQDLHDNKLSKGKYIILTGATRGLGRGVAGHLAASGAQLILPCRRCIPQELQNQVITDALTYSKKYSSNKFNISYHDILKPIVFDLDLADIREIDIFVQNYLDRKLPPANILILNAGLLSQEYKNTKQGFETTFGVNFYSSAYLTQKLLDNNLIHDKIISISSEGHRSIEPIHQVLKTQKKPIFGLSWGNGFLDTSRRYEYSKLAQTTYFLALGKRISIPIIDMCPGPVASEISRDAPELINKIIKLIFISIDQASIPVVYHALSKKNETSVHYQILEKRAARDDATNPNVQQQVYEWTQELIKQKIAPSL